MARDGVLTRVATGAAVGGAIGGAVGADKKKILVATGAAVGCAICGAVGAGKKENSRGGRSHGGVFSYSFSQQKNVM